MIAIVNGNPRADSRTGRLAHAVGNGIADRLHIADRRSIDLASLGYRLLVAGDVSRKIALTAIEEAESLVVATPTYKGSYTGILKVLLDALPSGGLAGKVAIPLVTAGTPAQADGAADKLVDLLSELGATVPGPALAVTESALGDLDSLAADLVDRAIGALAPQSA
ncbi:MAG TPA: NAD(P)H-dependent oxidoreductase [Micromonosporaceae bacterium]|jgi:FMN reductase